MTTRQQPGAALVGAGFIGMAHAEALRRLGAPVVGVLGSTPERGQAAAERMGVRRAYRSLDELLADPDVQVVHLASPNRLHFSQCRDSLAAGKHVICEKPLAMTTAESSELVTLAEAAQARTAVCYNVRFYPLCLESRQRILSGLLGRVYHVTGSYVQDWLLYDSDFNWRVLASEAGPLRAVADIGTHWLDLVTWITGLELESVCSSLQTFLPVRQKPAGASETFQGSKMLGQAIPVAIDTEDYGSVLLRFRGGATGAFTVSQVTAGRKNCLRFEIAGSEGSLAWNSERPDELWIGHRHAPNQLLLRDPALVAESVRHFTHYPGGHAEGFPDTFLQMFRAIYEDVAAEESRGPALFATFRDGHREMVWCEAILRSHEQRSWIDIPAIG